MENKLKIYDVKWESDASGPSPFNNIRTEVFLAGCRIAREGTPCPGCFNPELWQQDVYTALSSCTEVAYQIHKFGSKYVTFVGGEPLDQAWPLIEVCERLKSLGHHIIIITHYTINDIYDMGLELLFDVCDIIIDGEYKKELHQFSHDIKDGFTNVIGSGNQVVYDCKKEIGMPAGILSGISLDEKDNLIFHMKK